MAKQGRRTVVSIEDDEEFGRLLELMLRGEDVEVVRAINGQEGLRVVEELKPDLVVLDLMMPDIHGWQVFERMQAQKDLRDIPVVVVTALSSKADIAFGREVAGVAAYLVKPIRTAEFRSTVVEVLGGGSHDGPQDHTS